MFSKADSFPIKSIRTSGNKIMGNLSKNIQTYILGKKVKTNSEKKFWTHKMRYTILKANFQCRCTKDQVTDCESRKYCFNIKKQYPGFFNVLAKSGLNGVVSASVKSILFSILESIKSWAGNLKILHKKKTQQSGKGKDRISTHWESMNMKACETKHLLRGNAHQSAVKQRGKSPHVQSSKLMKWVTKFPW